MFRILIILILSISYANANSFNRIVEMYKDVEFNPEVLKSLDRLIKVLDKNLKSDSLELQKVSRAIIDFTIPEVLYCNYSLSRGRKYYYPLIKEGGAIESLKKFFHIKLTQNIAFSRKSAGLDENLIKQEDLAANLVAFLSRLLYFSWKDRVQDGWDSFIYNLNCIAGAFVFDTKTYSNGIDTNLKMAKNGVLKSIVNPKFSCISLTSFVILLVDIMNRDNLAFTKNSGNSEHSYIKTQSQDFPGYKIYIDPFSFYNEFKLTRKIFKRKKAEGFLTDYRKELSKIYPLAIAYEATKDNYRGIFFKGGDLSAQCNADVKVVFDMSQTEPNLEVTNLSPKCDGSIYYFRWINPWSKKIQSKIFTLLREGSGFNDKIIPGPTSTDYRTSVLLGDLSADFTEWLAKFFPDLKKMTGANFKTGKVLNYNHFVNSQIGDFSEFYKDKKRK